MTHSETTGQRSFGPAKLHFRSRARKQRLTRTKVKVSDTFGSVGHLLGYARVSTFDPHTDLRRDALKAAGCFRVFTDRASGTLDARKELAKVLDQLRVGGLCTAGLTPSSARR